MWKKTKQVAAFTLLECLVALLVLSGGLLVFDGLSRLLVKEVQHQEITTQKDWQVFSDQLVKELEGVRLVKIEDDRLYVDKDGQGLAFGKSKGNDFRKTNHKGQGYQPMLYGVTKVRIVQQENLVRLDVTFETGLERSFLYAFQKTD